MESIKINPRVLEHAQTLVQLSGDDTAAWAPVASPTEGEDMAELSQDGEFFVRTTFSLDLPLEQVIEAHFYMTHPDLAKWNAERWEKIEALSDRVEGAVHDMLARLELPALLRCLPGMSSHVHVRQVVQRDWPKEGHALVLTCNWDVENDVPITSSSQDSVVCVLLEPIGERRTLVHSVGRAPSMVPDGMSMSMSRRFVADLHRITERYKDYKVAALVTAPDPELNEKQAAPCRSGPEKQHRQGSGAARSIVHTSEMVARVLLGLAKHAVEALAATIAIAVEKVYAGVRLSLRVLVSASPLAGHRCQPPSCDCYYCNPACKCSWARQYFQ